LWNFVVNIIGAQSPKDIQKFKRLLDVDFEPDPQIVFHLKSLGARLDQLYVCQPVLLSSCRVQDNMQVLAAIDVLMSKPHNLTFEQLADGVDYVVQPENLEGFLSVLVKHGYSSASQVIAFKVCYRNVSPASLNDWLSLTREQGKSVPPDLLANWVYQTQKHGNLDAYRYLLSVIALPDLQSLKKVRNLAIFGRNILKYLVEEKELTSLSMLQNWYYHCAKNVHGLKWWGEYDDYLFRLLLDDAYKRQNYAFVTHNRSSVEKVLNERISLSCGSRPRQENSEECKLFDERVKAKRVLELESLLPILPNILEETDGILVDSLLRCAVDTPDLLKSQIDSFVPMISEFLDGRGPDNPHLGDLQVEILAMLYRSPTETVRSLWPDLIGYEEGLARFSLAKSYAVKWQPAALRLNSKMEQSSLLAMERAKQHAEKFALHPYDNIVNYSRQLRAKRFNDQAHDRWSLAAHLGILIAGAQHDYAILEWKAQLSEIITHLIDEGEKSYEYLGQLHNFFNHDLPDALEKNATHFLSRFSAEDARFLADRLVGSEALTSVSSELPKKQLQYAFKLVQAKVLKSCLRWLDREKAKFKVDKSDSPQTELTAMLSKHPAAYFAKYAANMCSKHRVNMWHESRHAHLIVFDQKRRRLAGMALVNIEIVPAIHPKNESLVIRAINPMDDMLATHTKESIAESFLDVAILIAKANNLAAVAMPWHNGAHLLSNKCAIEKYLKNRYLKKSEQYYSSYRESARRKPYAVDGQFYAYESGQELVSKLYVIWHWEETEIANVEVGDHQVNVTAA
jgi:hypothetical protein